MPEPTELFVPGRLCLFGEHSDWAGGHRRQSSDIEKGYALVVQTIHGNSATVKKIPEKVLRFISSDGEEFEVELNETQLTKEAESGGFFSYIAGVANEVISNYNNLSDFGIEINNTKTTLPVKKGLSSSASICVLTARAFNKVYNLSWTKRREMEIAYLGEITTPSRCGRLDQACAYECPVLMIFDAEKIILEEINISKPLYLIVVDLLAEKNTKKILADLNKGFPFPTTPDEIKKTEYLGGINKFIVLRAKQFLEQGDSESLGKLMAESQQKFDENLAPCCPEELTSPKLHQILSYQKIQPFIYGGKGVGSQGDGCAQLITRDNPSQLSLIETLNSDKELNVHAIPLTIHAD